MGAGLEEQVRQEQEAHEAQQGERTVEDMAEDAPEKERVAPMQVPLEGFGPTVTVQVGGDRPQTATIALRGGKLPVSGEFKKGDVIEFYVRARVSEVHFVDTVDKFGEVTGTERKHIAKPVAVTRMAAQEG